MIINVYSENDEKVGFGLLILLVPIFWVNGTDRAEYAVPTPILSQYKK